MTINEQIKNIVSHYNISHIGAFRCKCVGGAKSHLIAELIDLIQPKTTSTDIEELRKVYNERFTYGGITGTIALTTDNALAIWNFFAPHLSNKSELKKEAVQEFMEFCWDGGEHDGWIIAKADEYLSYDEKEENEKQ